MWAAMDKTSMTEFEKLKLPSNCVVLTAAEFLASVQPARDITRIGSKIVALVSIPDVKNTREGEPPDQSRKI
jgi:hypothetical protein